MMRLLAVVVRVAPIVVGASAAGCAQLAGIDDTTHVGNSLALTRMSVGATVTTAPLDIAGLDATYLVAGGDASGFSRVAATAQPARGMWTSNLREPAPVEFTLPDLPAPIPRQFAFPASTLSVLYAVLEHPDPTPAPDAATLTVVTPLDTPLAIGEVFQSFVVGAWLVRTFPAAEVIATGMDLTPPAFAFVRENSATGRGQVDRITMQDAFLVLRYVGAVLTGVAEAMPFEQTTAATTVTTGPMTAVAADQMLDVKVAPATLMGRLDKAQPKVGTLQISWNLAAAPGYQIASNSGPVLLSGNVTPTDVTVTAPFGNPFAARGWNTIFTLGAVQSRNYPLPGAMSGIDLFAGMNQFIEPSPGFDMTMPAGLPIVISLDDVPLVTDGQPVTRPGKFATVTFVVAPAPGATGPAATLYSLAMSDLVATPMMTAESRTRYVAVSDQPRFSLPPELFEVDHSYTLRVTATLGGFPLVGSGDFVHRELPLAQSFLDSGVFVVKAAP